MKNISKSILLKVVRILDCHMYNLKKIRFSNLRTKSQILQKVLEIYHINPTANNIVFRSRSKFIQNLYYCRLTKNFHWESMTGRIVSSSIPPILFEISHCPVTIVF